MFSKVIGHLVFFLIIISFFASQAVACFSIVVGKEACANGYVLAGHNEDDGPPQIVNHHKISGGQIVNGKKTPSYIWSEMPGMDYSDSYINQYGVVVTSNNCPSKEDSPQFTDGGIGKELRRKVALQAKTARSGVELAGRLVEQFGYLDSGRTYIIADPNEGWIFCVVKGKHWVAQRVPDDQVAMVANTYTIQDVNPADSNNFLASRDIIEYAVKRGWYDPNDGRFDFADAYANPRDAESPVNYGRQWAGLQHITNQDIKIAPDLPFVIKPNEKISAEQLMEILRFDDAEARPDLAAQCSEAEQVSCVICRGSTQTSFVAELRGDMPADIGIRYWLCLSQPSRSFYIPFYFGIDKFPQGYCLESQRPTTEEFERKINAPFKADANEAFWTFSNYSSKVKDKTDMEFDFVQRFYFASMNQISGKILEELESEKSGWSRKEIFYASQALYSLCLQFMGDIIKEGD